MKQEELISYVYDFISQLMDHHQMPDTIRRIILFGSVARGDFDRDSDLDLFIDVKNAQPDVSTLIKNVLNQFETRAERTWKLRGVHPHLKLIIDDFGKQKWRELRQEIGSYGVLLYGPFREVPQKVSRWMLIAYELNQLPQKGKMALLRRLYGYTTKKGRKEYQQEGLLQELGGVKMGANVLLVPQEGFAPLKKILVKLRVPYTVKDMWG